MAEKQSLVVDGEILEHLLCASTSCEGRADLVCSRCSLVAYCSKTCQKNHWPQHKSDCNHELSKETWYPAWHRDGRNPAFVNNDIERHIGFGNMANFGEKMSYKFLWGNMPAIDVLRLEDNEGSDYDKDLSVCFAASGDMRNVVATVLSLQTSYKSQLRIILNDRDIDIVARNVFLLLIMAHDNIRTSVDTAVHLWYSSRLTSTHRDIMRQHVRPLILDVIQKIVDKSDQKIFCKSFCLAAKCNIKVKLYKFQWLKLLEILDRALEVRETERNRRAVVLGRIDYFDRALFQIRKSLHQRVSMMQFRQRGVLLPFGSDDRDFTHTNTTLFDNDGDWLQKDSANPLEGWLATDVQALQQEFLKPLRNDLYGSMYFWVRRQLHQFHSKMRQSRITLELSAMPAQNLKELTMLEATFDRVEVSNIIDECYLGAKDTLALAKSLLNPSNQKATLISLFLNAIDIISRYREREVLPKTLMLSTRFLGFNISHMTNHDAEFLRASFAKALFMPFNQWFDEYSNLKDFKGLALACAMQEKPRNTIVPKWPMRLKERIEGENAQEEFDNLLASPFTGSERYVEWKLVDLSPKMCQSDLSSQKGVKK